MCVKGNPNSCPPQSICVNTQTCEVSKAEEGSFSPQTSYEDEKEEEEVYPFLTCFGEMSDKALHNMMNVDDLMYSTLFCDKVFDNDLWSSCASMESCNVMGEYTRHPKEAPETSNQSARERGCSYYESTSDEEDDEDDELHTGYQIF